MYGIRTCSTSREPSRYNTSSSCLKTCQVLSCSPHRPAPVRLVPEPARPNTRHARHWKSPPVVSSHSPKGPWLHWSVELRGSRRAQNRLLSPVCMSMAALHLQGRRSVIRISSRHARRHALLLALLFLLSLSSICVLAPPAAMEPRRTPQPLLSPLPPSPPSLTRGRTRPGPH